MEIEMQPEAPRFIDLNEVRNRVCLGKTTILHWEAKGLFPRAVRLSKTKRVWLEKDVNNWVLEQHSRITSEYGGQQCPTS